MASAAAFGMIAAPDEADADSDFGVAWEFFVVAMIFVVLVVAADYALKSDIKTVKIVESGKAKSGKPAQQRLRAARKIAKVRQVDDTLYAEMNARGRKTVEKNLKVPMPIPVRGEDVELLTPLRKSSKHATDSFIAAAKSARKRRVVGALLMNSHGLILNTPRSKLDR